ncbi:MAG: hypothetical protein JWO63_2616 [Frankiales bacterium]|nr:hypothetical protein [Frankiales bacterium]
MSRRGSALPPLTAEQLRLALTLSAEDVRSACAPLADLSEAELGAQLLRAVALHAQRSAAELTEWARICLDFGRELAAAAPDSGDSLEWAAAHGIEVVEQDADVPANMVIAQYTTRPARIVLYPQTLDFAEAVIDTLGWRAQFGPDPVRQLAIEHEIAHRLIDGPAARELKRRLRLTSLRVGRFAVLGHVVGADELVCHSYAQSRSPFPGGSSLALAVALNRAARIAIRTARPPAPPPLSLTPTPTQTPTPPAGNPSRRSLPWAS